MTLPVLCGGFAAAFLIATFATPWAMRRARRTGALDRPGEERKAQNVPVPYGGGWAIYIAFTATMLAGWGVGAVFHRHLQSPGALDGWPSRAVSLARLAEPYLSGLLLPRALAVGGGLLAGGTGMFLLGCRDDRRPLSAMTKFLWQMLFAAFPVAAGVRLTLPVDSEILAILVTWLWIVAIANAFNLLDNMDGLSAGVAGLAAALFVVTAVGTGQVFVAGALAALAGAAFGFLRYNFAPARVYMGDAGSLFIGYSLATLTAATTFYAGQDSLYALAAPGLALAVPLYDSVTVVAYRVRRGRPWWQGDRNHLSHRLVRMGMTVREAVLTIYLLGLIMGGLSILLLMVGSAGAVIVLLLGLGVLALLMLLERAGRARE